MDKKGQRCENHWGTKEDKEKSEKLKSKPSWQWDTAESEANLFNAVAMANSIYDECVGWLCNQLPIIHPTDNTSQAVIHGDGKQYRNK